MTLFLIAAPQIDLFQHAINKYYDGHQDRLTIDFFRCGFLSTLPLTPLGIEPFVEVRQGRITHLFKLNTIEAQGVPGWMDMCEDIRSQSTAP